MSGLRDGAAFALDVPTHVEAIWGDGAHVLWAEGEPLMLAGPDGVGKTTIAQQFVLRRIGLLPPTLLGHPVTPDLERKVLYLALDRPRQAARSMRRMVTEADRATLEARLVVWEGALPFNMVNEPERLLAFAQEHEAGTVIIDTLKDVAASLSDETTGQAINTALQLCVAEGVEAASLHHQRKAQGDNKRPRKLADVYGSRWLTAGCGSVVMLWGEAGDPIVEFTHLKQPVEEVGPLTLLHDNATGRTTLAHSSDVGDLLESATAPLTVKDIATSLFHVREPKENDLAKARRRLHAAAAEGRAVQMPTDPGEPALWVAGGLMRGVDTGLMRGVDGEGLMRPVRSKATTAPVDGGAAKGVTAANGDGEPVTAAVGADPAEGDDGHPLADEAAAAR
jgi:replicative DNA helicase